MNEMIPASMSPQWFPIITPSSGVSPMLVSTETPFLRAQSDTPSPVCTVTMLQRSSGTPARAAPLLEAYRWDCP